MTPTEQPIEQIVQMNKAICEFLGFYVTEFNGRYHFVCKEKKKPEDLNQAWEFRLEDAKYHSSWEELHGAWNKLYERFLGLSKKEYKDSQNFTDLMAVAMITGNIIEAHRILYAGIIWLNKQNDNVK